MGVRPGGTGVGWKVWGDRVQRCHCLDTKSMNPLKHAGLHQAPALPLPQPHSSAAKLPLTVPCPLPQLTAAGCAMSAPGLRGLTAALFGIWGNAGAVPPLPRPPSAPFPGDFCTGACFPGERGVLSLEEEGSLDGLGFGRGWREAAEAAPCSPGWTSWGLRKVGGLGTTWEPGCPSPPLWAVWALWPWPCRKGTGAQAALRPQCASL